MQQFQKKVNLAIKALKMSSSDVEKLKSSMTGWREILVMVHSVVTWEQVCGDMW